MSDKVTLSHIKSEPLEDGQHVAVCAEGSEEFVEELEKQLANNLTLQEIPSEEDSLSTRNSQFSSPNLTTTCATSVDIENVDNLKRKLKESETCIVELKTCLAATKSELTTMKGKYLTEKITLESITKAKWKSAEQIKKESHEKDTAALKATFDNTLKSLTQKNDSLTNDVTRLEADLKQSLSNRVQLETDLGASRSSVRLLTDKLIRAETSLEENLQAKEKLEQLNSIAKNQCSDLLRQVEVFKCNEQSNLAQLRSLEDKAEHLSLLSVELPVLRSQHDVTKNKLIKAESKILQLESEVMDYKKKALSVNLVQRKLQQAQDDKKSSDSAMAILIKKLATLEHVKEDADLLRSALNQSQEEKTDSRSKIKRLKRRLAREIDCKNLLIAKWDKLTLFLRLLEEKAATGELLTRSDFDTVLNFVLNSQFLDLKKESNDSNHDESKETCGEIADDGSELELSSSHAKNTIEKVVKKFKAVKITSKRYPSTSRSPTKSSKGVCRNDKVLCSRKVTNVRMTRSNLTCKRGSVLSSDLRHRRSRSVSPVCYSGRKRRSASSARRSNSRSLSVETISRSPSPSSHYKRCRYRRSRSRSYTRSSKSYKRYSPFSCSSRSSSREKSTSRSFSNNYKESRCNRKTSVDKQRCKRKTSVDKQRETHSEKQHKSKGVLKRHPLELEKVLETDANGRTSSPEIITITNPEENRQESNDSPLEEGEIVNDLVSPVIGAETITEAEWDALILSPKDSLGVDKLTPALAQVSLQYSNGMDVSNQVDCGNNPALQLEQSENPVIQEILVVESNQDSCEVTRSSSPAPSTMTHCTSEPGTSRQSPDIVPLFVVPADDVSERETPAQTFVRVPLFAPLVPPPTPPPCLALELKNIPVITSSNHGNYVLAINDTCNWTSKGIYQNPPQIRRRSNFCQQEHAFYTPSAEENWDAESDNYSSSIANPAQTAIWSRSPSRANYNNVNNLRIVVPPRRPYRPKNKRKFAPYMREDRSSSTKIPFELNMRGDLPQQPLPGCSIVDEFLQQYTVSIIKEIPGYSEKHPVEALKALCVSKGWEEPKYSYHADTTTKPRTLEYFCKVFVNNVLYQPKYGSGIKTDAQTIAAIYCLQQLGINP